MGDIYEPTGNSGGALPLARAMARVLVLVAGVFGIVIIGLTVWRLWSEGRKIVATPEEIHVEVGKQGSSLLVLLRKNNRWPFTYEKPRIQHKVQLKKSPNVSGRTEAVFVVVGPAAVKTRDSMLIVTVLGVSPGTDTLTIQDVSAGYHRNMKVHVHARGAVPEGVIVTPEMRFVDQSGESGEGGTSR